MKKNIKKGFTLVELIAVIVILSLILALIVPKVFQTIDESKKKSCDIQLKYIVDAASTYFVKNRYNRVDVNNILTYDDAAMNSSGINIKLSKLIGSYLLKGTIKNPVTDQAFDPENTYVNVKNNNSKFIYTVLICDGSSCEAVECE